jgi:hypothetical protein
MSCIYWFRLALIWPPEYNAGLTTMSTLRELTDPNAAGACTTANTLDSTSVQSSIVALRIDRDIAIQTAILFRSQAPART